MKILRRTTILFACLLTIPSIRGIAAQTAPGVNGPVEHVYAEAGGVKLKIYVFSPSTPKPSQPRAAIVLFHGGGWVAGEPQWAFTRAQHFAERGMTAFAAQYRLSDEKTGVTPLEAMDDAKAAIRWIRTNAASLGIDPGRIAAYGWSAGGHLAACAAVFDETRSGDRISASPNALILVSPAVSLGSDSWTAHVLGKRAKAADISPDEHVRKGLPPTLVLQGSSDTLTPLAGAKRFCDRMLAAGNACELHVYQGYGHLFTPVGTPDFNWPQPDLAIQADSMFRADGFLRGLGFMPPIRSP